MDWRIKEQGDRAVIDVWREESDAGLFRASIRGGSESFPLGALLPENGRLHLRRVLSVDDLKRRGFWPIRQIGEELVCPFQKAPETEKWTDAVLRRCAARLPRYTARRMGEYVVFSFRFDPASEFPFVPAFCFSCVENGVLIFAFRTDGTPYFLPSEGNHRGEVDRQRREPYGKSDDQGTQRAGRSAGL